jgi:hypothetical protein
MIVSKTPLNRNRKLKGGDIVEIEWRDTHSTDRVSLDEVAELDDPCTTMTYGIVLKNTREYITVANEICAETSSDGTWIEQIPHCSIKGAKVLGKRNLSDLD